VNATKLFLLATVLFIGALGSTSHAATILYTQNFENPVGFVQSSVYKDLSQQSVNTLYANQPVGFTFSQAFTVETIHLTGGTAFGTGYVDPTGQGDDYSLGMLSTLQNDLLGLSFDVGANDFLNFQLDVSRLGVEGPNGPAANGAPSFRFRLFDNPTGAANLQGNGTLLSFSDLSGADSTNNFTLNWTTLLAPLDASSSSNGKVTLQIDLLSGGYATMDNFIVAASNQPGDVTPPPSVPEPGILMLLSIGLAGMLLASLRRKRVL